MSFRGTSYVDARGSTFNHAGRDQYNIGVNPERAGSSKRQRFNTQSSSSMPDNNSDPPSWAPGASDPPSWINLLRDFSQSTARSDLLQQRRVQTFPSLLNSLAPMISTSILHTTQLSISRGSVDQALADFETDISPWKDPVEWVAADSEHVNFVVKEIVELTDRVEINQARFADQLIVYPRLIVYIFSHLMFCMRDKRLLDEFTEKLREWKTWDNITVIQNHQQIMDYLRGLFRNLHADPHLHPERTFENILAYDVIGLAARLTNIVMDDNRYEILIARRDADAQSLLDLLQARLDLFTGSALKRRLVKLLIKLSKNSGLYPQCLVLKGVKRIGHPVAGGGFGDVYRGQFQGHEVAVKVLKIYRTSDMGALLKEFSCEAVTWRQLDHPNILPLYGVNCQPTVSLISPWLDNGNVVDYLAQRAPESNCVLLSLDVAEGLEYLHLRGMIHGDMKGLNILITRSHRACLADFGLAIARDANPALTTVLTSVDRPAGTARWQAPELFLNVENREQKRRKTEATDIYAFALICYEMFSGQYPFLNISHEWLIAKAVMEGQRPARPSHDLSRIRGLTDDIWRLIETCWSQDPAKRPGANQIVNDLRVLPNRPLDTRSLDNFTYSSLMSMHNSAGHPFGALEIDSEDTDRMRHLKHISRD